jgi:hypothetical protein
VQLKTVWKFFGELIYFLVLYFDWNNFDQYIHIYQWIPYLFIIFHYISYSSYGKSRFFEWFIGLFYVFFYIYIGHIHRQIWYHSSNMQPKLPVSLNEDMIYFESDFNVSSARPELKALNWTFNFPRKDGSLYPCLLGHVCGPLGRRPIIDFYWIIEI